MKAITLAFLLVPMFFLVKMPVAVEAKFLDELSLEEIIRWNTEFSHLQLKELYDGYLPRAKIPNPKILILSIPKQAGKLFSPQTKDVPPVDSTGNVHQSWHGQLLVPDAHGPAMIDIYIGLANNSYQNLLSTILLTRRLYLSATRINSWYEKNPIITPDMMSTTPFDFVAWFSPGFLFSFDAAYFNLKLSVHAHDNMLEQPIDYKYFEELSSIFAFLFEPPTTDMKNLQWVLPPDVIRNKNTANVRYVFPPELTDFWWRVDSNQGILSIVSESEIQVNDLTSERPLELTFYAISPDGAEWYSAQVVILPKSQELSSQVDVNTEEEDK